METERSQESSFFGGLMKLPFVASVTGQVSEVYSRTKEYNEVLKYTMETAESVVKYGVESSKPLVNKLEKPIAVFDNLAYEQLKKLEANCPIISKPAAEILESTKYALGEVKNYSTKTVTIAKDCYENLDTVKNYGYEMALCIKDYGVERMSTVLESEIAKDVVNATAEMVSQAEKYFSVNPKCKNSGNHNNVERLVVLSDRARTRLHCIALEHIEKLKNKAIEKMEEMKAVLYFLKEGLTSSSQSYNRHISNLWLELTKEEENGEVTNLKEKLLQKARILTKSLSHIFKQASTILTYISINGKPKVLEVSQEAYNLHNAFQLVSASEEITHDFIQNVQEKLQKFQQIITSYGNFKFLILQEMSFESLEPRSNISADQQKKNDASPQT